MVLFFFFCLPGASSVIKTGWALRRAGQGEGEAGAETDKGHGEGRGAGGASPAAASCIPRDHRVCVLLAALAPLGASLAPRGAHVQGLSTLSFFFFSGQKACPRWFCTTALKGWTLGAWWWGCGCHQGAPQLWDHLGTPSKAMAPLGVAICGVTAL